MTVPPTHRPGGLEKVELLTINVAKLRVMLKEQRELAELASKKVAGIQLRLKQAAAAGASLPAAQVAEHLTTVSTFFKLEGRVTQLEELLKDFDALIGNKNAGTKRPQPRVPQGPPQRGDEFRL